MYVWKACKPGCLVAAGELADVNVRYGRRAIRAEGGHAESIGRGGGVGNLITAGQGPEGRGTVACVVSVLLYSRRHRWRRQHGRGKSTICESMSSSVHVRIEIVVGNTAIVHGNM